MRVRQIAIWSALAATAAAVAFWALRPVPVQVDLATARVAPMEVTVSAEGVTRVRDPWTVTAPLTGTAIRSPVEVGDAVRRGETIVAVIQPAEPAFLDDRARLQAEAAVTEAEAAVRLAEVKLARAEADLAYADSQLARNRALAARGTVPQRILEDSEQAAATAATALEAARFELDLNRATLARMQAQLHGPELRGEDAAPGDCCIRIPAPLDGTVLAVTEMDARLVQAGSPLLTIGNLTDLEIETDLLSSDAVRVAEGALAHVERWGGPGTIDARVRRIDPAGFTRVSALGIEEQRVGVHLDILTPPEGRPGLGDQYRVFVRIVVWSDKAVLQVPQSALFRHQDGWAVFRAAGGRAVLTPVQIGHAHDTAAEVLSGLAEGDVVIAYPGNSVTDGARIAQRQVD
jgi:HlyD family secretion protein